jgi:hypothetical protein
MLELEKVTEISTEIAKANFGPENVVRVESEPTADSQGEEALNLLIVMAPAIAESIDGDAVLDTLVQIIDRLQQAGDERFPIIEYATEEELADLDSTLMRNIFFSGRCDLPRHNRAVHQGRWT